MSDRELGSYLSFMALALACIALLLALAGCKDRGDCLSSHREKRIERKTVNGHTRTSTRWSTVCDRWQFPNGRPEK